MTPRALFADPALYDHKLIRVTGQVSHGFENFTLRDPTLDANAFVWLEYGGRVASKTTYCCGSAPGELRTGVLTIDGIAIPLKADKQFRRFDALVKRKEAIVAQVTMVGRFFAGERTSSPNGDTWTGYGHLGCCSLLAIRQIVSVKQVDRTRDAAEQQLKNSCNRRLSRSTQMHESSIGLISGSFLRRKPRPPLSASGNTRNRDGLLVPDVSNYRCSGARAALTN